MKMEAAFNRRMRKTARTVVWEGAGAQSPAPDPIGQEEAMSMGGALSYVSIVSLLLLYCSSIVPLLFLYCSSSPGAVLRGYPAPRHSGSTELLSGIVLDIRVRPFTQSAR
jgi:hypothetical protein